MKVWLFKDELWPVYLIGDQEGSYADEVELTQEEIDAYENAYKAFMIELNKLHKKVEGLGE